MPTSRRARLVDVAQHAGVSISAASVALAGGPGVSATTRTRVELSARALGYKRDHAAAALRSGRTGLVAVAAPPDSPLPSELAKRLAERCWLVVVAPADLSVLDDRAVDALVLVGGKGATDWAKTGRPLLCIGATRVPGGAARLPADADADQVADALTALLT